MTADWLDNGLPVSHGGKDKNEERTALQALGGPSGFKTREITLPDGMIMRVQTKGDMPPQVTYVKSLTQTQGGDTPAEGDWRLWHGLFTEDEAPTSSSGVLNRNAAGKLPLSDWGRAEGYSDGDVIEACVPLTCGETYYSNFAIIPPEERTQVRQVGDYAISAASGGPYRVTADKDPKTGIISNISRVNDPFFQGENSDKTPSLEIAADDWIRQDEPRYWPWKDPISNVVHWFHAVYDRVAETMNVYRYSADGSLLLVGSRQFSRRELYGRPVGTGDRLPRFEVASPQHSASGRVALLMGINRERTPTSSNIDVRYFLERASFPLQCVVKAEVRDKDEVSLSLFKSTEDLYFTEGVLGGAPAYAVYCDYLVNVEFTAEAIVIPEAGYGNNGAVSLEDYLDDHVAYWYGHHLGITRIISTSVYPSSYSETYAYTERRILWYFFEGESEEPIEVARREQTTRTYAGSTNHNYSGTGTSEGLRTVGERWSRTTLDSHLSTHYQETHGENITVRFTVGNQEFELTTYAFESGTESTLESDAVPHPFSLGAPNATTLLPYWDSYEHWETSRIETQGVNRLDPHAVINRWTDEKYAACSYRLLTNNILCIAVQEGGSSLDWDEHAEVVLLTASGQTKLDATYRELDTKLYASWNPRTGDIAVSLEGRVQWL
jgi:hypothetical protein